jgi:hypothetical protein
MLHIFRRPLIILGALVVIAVVALSAALLSTAYFDQQYADAHYGCRPGAPNHMVTIQGNSVLPAHTNAAKCDTMTITNLDDTRRLMAFGHHDDHVPYDGIKERYLTKDQSITVTLDQTGEFLFHDHLHDEVQGTFTVH